MIVREFLLYPSIVLYHFKHSFLPLEILFAVSILEGITVLSVLFFILILLHTSLDNSSDVDMAEMGTWC